MKASIATETHSYIVAKCIMCYIFHMLVKENALKKFTPKIYNTKNFTSLNQSWQYSFTLKLGMGFFFQFDILHLVLT